MLTGQKRLAFASKTPGRTQLLNFFELSERDQDKQIVPRGMLVDLPGMDLPGRRKHSAANGTSWSEVMSHSARRWSES